MKKHVLFLVIVWMCLITLRVLGQNITKERSKRHIVFPVGAGIFKLIVGLGIPTKLGIKQSMALGVNFQFQYRLPDRIYDLESYPPIVAKARERRDEKPNAISNDRVLFYLGLEAALQRNGSNGKSCVLRSICDNAMHSLHHEANGLFGELMHIALTPVPAHQHSLAESHNVYIDAQRAGEFGVDCASLYPGCPTGVNLLDALSVLDN